MPTDLNNDLKTVLKIEVFVCNATNFSDEKLQTYSRSAYNTVIRCYNEDHYKNLCNIKTTKLISRLEYP